jgi:predicted glycogen debranching enzyme
MGTISGLATRRYHGLLVVATDPPRTRKLGLVSLDPTLVVGDLRIELATHEWASGALAPAGYRYLTTFRLDRGVPRWRWQVGDIVLEVELAMTHGTPAVGIVHRLIRAPRPIRLEIEALGTWRDVHGERSMDGEPRLDVDTGGCTLENAFRVRGPGFTPTGGWYHDLFHREEAARGLAASEDVIALGTFGAELFPGETIEIEAWGMTADAPPAAAAIVAAQRERYRTIATQADAIDDHDRALVWAADQFVVAGPTVVAGYPWFGDWSRDTMTSYAGLFLETGRVEEGRALLTNAAATVSQGMLANTADVGGTEYNTVDAAPWFLHTVASHAEATGDRDLVADVWPAIAQIIDHHVAGTRYGIRVDEDGLITQGAPDWALTWMDARVGGVPATPRWGKPVEVNALWVSGLARLGRIGAELGRDVNRVVALEATARRSFAARYPAGAGLYDVIDGPGGDDATRRPNQLLAVSLPDAPLSTTDIVAACTPLLTPLGLRSLEPANVAYTGRHRGDAGARDRAYHQGTVWPWLIGPFVDACLRIGADSSGLLDGLEEHLGDFGLGSVSETADGDAPHGATGCPYQAWSVAEVLRARRRVMAR